MTHCTGKRRGRAVRSPPTSTVSRCSSSVWPSYHRSASDAVDDVVALQRRDRDRPRVAQAQTGRELGEIAGDVVEALLGEVDEIHLVDREHDVRQLEHREHVGVSPGLLDDALAGVDEDHGEVGRRGAGDHVARVLDVAGRVGELEAPARRDEPAVGDIDRDPLLALGSQAVHQQREVDVVVPAAPRGVFDVLELVDEDLLRVEEQPADQRRLAVVDRARRDQAEQIGVQHLPGAPRSPYQK